MTNLSRLETTSAQRPAQGFPVDGHQVLPTTQGEHHQSNNVSRATASQVALYLTEEEIEWITQGVETGEIDATEEQIVALHDRLTLTAANAFIPAGELLAELDDEEFPPR